MSKEGRSRELAKMHAQAGQGAYAFGLALALRTAPYFLHEPLRFGFVCYPGPESMCMYVVVVYMADSGWLIADECSPPFPTF